MEELKQSQIKSLWQQTQDTARLFNCFRCCGKRRVADDEDDAVDQAALMDDSQILDNS